MATVALQRSQKEIGFVGKDRHTDTREGEGEVKVHGRAD
jgi:hypothetical protein